MNASHDHHKPPPQGLAARLVAAGLLLLCGAVQAQDYSGLVQARHDLLLSVSVPGVVTRVGVEVGRRVEPQQLLLVLDDQPQAIEVTRRQAISQDQSELLATQERVRVLGPLYEDSRRLLHNGTISRDELARLELEYSAAQGRLQQLQAQKKREQIELAAVQQERLLRNLKAPVAGVITRVDIAIGEWARPGDALVQLVDAAVCFVRFNLPYEQARTLAPGAKLTLRFDPATKLAPVTGNVSYVAPVAEPASGLVELRVSFANPKLQVPPGIKAVLRMEGGVAK